MREGVKQMWNTLSRTKLTSPPAHFIGELRKLTEVDVTCLGLATTLGTGVYVLVAVGAHEHAGPSIVLSILTAAVLACLGGMCYSEVVTRFPKGGSAYTYAYATSGELPAFLIGWGMVLDYSIGTALAAKAFSQHLDLVTNGQLSSIFCPHFVHLNLRGLDKQLDFPSVITILVVAIVLVVSTKFLCSLTNILVVINFLVISGVVLVGIFYMDSENWIAGRGFFPGKMEGMISAASIYFYAFVGYDIMALCSVDSPHRARNYPTMVTTLFIIGLMSSFAIGVILTLLIPYVLLETKGSILEAFDLRQVDGMRYFASVGAISGLLSAVIASLFALVKLLQSLSNDGLLFRFLSRTRCHTLLASGVLCSILSCFCDIEALVHVLGMGTMASSVAVSLSVLSLRYGVSDLQSPADVLELSDESSTGTPKVPEHKVDPFTEKGSMQDVRHKMDYGSLRGRSFSVDMVDESYVTCLTEMSPHWTKQEPTHRSAATAAGLVAAAMLVMLLMCVMAIHVPKVIPRSKSFIIELVVLALFALIVLIWIAICKQPRRRVLDIPNLMPCVPFLPLSTVLMDLHLIIELPYMAWITFFIWTLIGTLLYISYGIWNSSERKTSDAQNETLLAASDDIIESDSTPPDDDQ